MTPDRTVLPPENRSFKLVLCLLFLANAPHPAHAQEGTPATDSNPLEGATSPAPKLKYSPARAPQVSYTAGQLTIIADNSTMSSVFSAIHACLGLDLQIPLGSADDRTFLTVGPGPAREVLNEFLSGSDFDYVIQSSLSKPGEVQSVQLTARAKDLRDGRDGNLATDLTMTPARRAWLASRNAGRGVAPEESASASDASEPSTASDSSPSGSVDAKNKDGGVDAAADAKDQTGDQKQNQSKDQPAANLEAPAASAVNASGSPGAEAAPAQPPGTSDGRPTTPEPSVLQKQITQMEQLFEQRKQMIAKPAQTPAQSPAQTPDSNQ